MFGYLRPDKETMQVKEFTLFRAVYCGICKEIKRTYGNLPRITLTYDMTILAVLLLSLDEEDAQVHKESCILNPLKQKPVAFGHAALAFSAAASVLFAYYKLQDEISDSGRTEAKAARILLTRAYRKAAARFPETNEAIDRGIRGLSRLESTPPGPDAYREAAILFGDVLHALLRCALQDYFVGEEHRDRLLDGVGLLGAEIGQWIYIMDALDDYPKDIRNHEWNPFSSMDKEQASRYANDFLLAREVRCDEIAALLPYRRNAGILANLFQSGMPLVRSKVLRGEPLGRL
jgi:hypothetical protein